MGESWKGDDDLAGCVAALEAENRELRAAFAERMPAASPSPPLTIDPLRVAERVGRLGVYKWELPTFRVWWSPGMYELLGYAGTEEPSEQLFWDRVHPDDLPRLLAERAHILETGSGAMGEVRLVLPGGVVRQVAIHREERYDDAGRIVGVCGVVQDVTRRHLLEEQLRHSQKMEAIGTLAGGVAHDFNNYLMLLSSEAEALGALLPAGHLGHECVDSILGAVDRCAALTRQLLTLGRRHSATPSRVHLGDLVARTVPLLRSMLGSGVEVALHVEDGPVDVHADAAQLEQALLNLAVNARDAMNGLGKLTIRVAPVVTGTPDDHATPSRREARVRLSVSDTGCGIAPEHLPRIFEPFFTTKRAGHGTGLGLSSVYGIVEQAGGSIDVESAVGAGSTFHVLLPPAAMRPDATEGPPASVRTSGPPRSLLLVDDVEQLREALRSQLASAGYRVLTAGNGREALELLEAGATVDVVVTDVVMPLLGGVELEKRLRARHPDVRCLLMTGHADGLRDDELRRVLRKPFSRRELLDAIDVLLARAPELTSGAS